MNDAQIIQYLKRIQLDDFEVNLDGLKRLQEQHTIHIPFENLDIVVGRAIALNPERLFDKIVLNNRGGYCFELNILFAELLKSLGFSVQPVLGRVWFSNPLNTPPRNHLAYLIALEGKTFVCDVGFGGLVNRFPLDIHTSDPVDDKDGMVRVLPIHEGEFMVQRQTEKGWENQYSFEDVEISKDDIEIAHYYMSTHPNSHLIKHKCVGRNTEHARIGLFNNKFTLRKGMKIVNRTRIEFGDEWLTLLKNEFSIDLDFTEEELAVLLEQHVLS